jgi:hypothetical protein
MKNPAPFIRESLVTLLDGAITYEGETVHCYEGEGEEGERYQILLAEQNINGRDDKSSSNNEVSQLIEVISQQSTDLNKHVDAIGAEVMELMQPSVITKGMADSADFQVMNLHGPFQTYRKEHNADGFVNRLLLRYTFLIVQK